MGNPISNDKMKEINISAVLSQYVYADDQSIDYIGENKTISKVVEQSEKDRKSLGRNDTLKLSIDKYDIGNFELVAQSSTTVLEESETGHYEMKELISCAFRDPETGDIYIVYRGTGDGKWVDNGDAFTKYSSLMQQRASQFFDDVIEKTGYNTNKRGKIFVSGHSKGGNLAQFAMMDSQYGDLVDNCYSFNGQGFSREAIEAFKKRWGEDYQKQIDKMYSINGVNDYVHDLGNVIIDKEKTYFIPTSGNGFNEWHSLDFFFNKDGSIRWEYDENGNIVFTTEQGPVGKLAAKISARIMSMDKENLEDCAVSVMWLLEAFLGGKDVYGEDVNSRLGTGDRKIATIEEIGGLLSTGIPAILDILGTSEELPEILASMGLEEYLPLVEEIQKFVKENNVDLGQYIFEDPLRLIKIYASLDLSKKTIHELVLKVLHFKNIATVTVFLVNPALGTAVTFVGKIVAAVTTVALIANHIIVNWDKIVQNVKLAVEYIGQQIGKAVDYISTKIVEGAEYVKDKVVQAIDFVQDKVTEFYNELRETVRVGLNSALEKVYSKAEEIITKGRRVVNAATDAARKVLNAAKKVSVAVIDTVLKYTQPILYSIASKVYKLKQGEVRINLKKLKQCVNTLYRLASRISSLDSRLDSLYYRLAQNNIEQEEGVFTSFASMYNLFRADLNIDEGASIRRKANELSTLLEGFESVERIIINNAPKKI